MSNALDRFLRETGMHWEAIDLERGCDRFVEEMRRGLEGRESSLLMLPTYLQAEGKPPWDKEILVMDAGGTHFRVAMVSFQEEGPTVSGFHKYPMPGTRGRVSASAFFDAIAEGMMPVISASQKVGFCFSYPAEIQPNRDGRITRLCKEVQVDGAEGLLVGEGVNLALSKRGIRPKSFVLLNDTVATMLGGVATTGSRVYDGHVGYILGTGTNTCYLERCENIKKDSEIAALGGSMVVNVESGGFGGFPQGEVDRELDAASASPGVNKMEKMMSGQYMGNLIYRTVKKAVEAKLFSGMFAARLEELDDFSPYEVDRFCDHPFGDNPLAALCAGQEADTRTLYGIVDAAYERAARVTAANLGAILLQTDAGKSPVRPVSVTAEGTTFYKAKLFRGKLDYYVRVFLNGRLGRHVVFRKVEDATLVGTALAALLN